MKTAYSMDSDPSLLLKGIVERVTFHSADTGWSVLKVTDFSSKSAGQLITVVVHQAQVFAGSSMQFWGKWVKHPKHGEQFLCEKCMELKPASSGAMEKYLGSGLIRGVGPVIAKRIVGHFGASTLGIFEDRIEELLLVPGIAQKKLVDIKESWVKHKSIRDVMLFLQGFGISTLYAVKIFKAYGTEAIQKVSEDPYRLARDIYGIGFFSADKVALALGVAPDSVLRLTAAIRHILSAAREQGHCFLLKDQIIEQTKSLLSKIGAGDSDAPKHLNTSSTLLEKSLCETLFGMEAKNELKTRAELGAYYSKTLYYEEKTTETCILELLTKSVGFDKQRAETWLTATCAKQKISLSAEQREAVLGIPVAGISLLTGGPGCGKTTTTNMVAKLFIAMGRRVVLAAPTGRAAQRMSEVIGMEAKTLHRLLSWNPAKGGFLHDETNLLSLDVLILDECSMLDISLAAAVLKALPKGAQILLIGDPHQLPSVGPGQVLADLLATQKVPTFCLTQVFRQAATSDIVTFAHAMQKENVPPVPSPIAYPKLWSLESILSGHNCLFLDAEEPTQDQAKIIYKIKAALQMSRHKKLSVQWEEGPTSEISTDQCGHLTIQSYEPGEDPTQPELTIPKRFGQVNLQALAESDTGARELATVLAKVHPWSALHKGLLASDALVRLIEKTLPTIFGRNVEVQVLCPQQRGSLGAVELNARLQSALNPGSETVKQWRIGERIFRENDRVIQTRNNYDLGVFNGDIGRITSIDFENEKCFVQFPDRKEPIAYGKEDLLEISLAYAITIHKSQGSEFEIVVIPVSNQHFKMLFRNLIYTGLTRAKKLCVFVGSRKALSLAVHQTNAAQRQTGLLKR